MASLEYGDRQRFQTKDGTALASLRSHPSAADTTERYLLWTDIQRRFQGMDHLEAECGGRILFSIDADGELWYPLRIQHDPHETYIVIFGNNQRQIEKSYLMHNQAQCDSQNQMLGEIQPPLNGYLDTRKHLYQHQQKVADVGKEPFRQAVANTRYCHSMLMGEVERLDKAGANSLLDGKDRKRIPEELCDLEQQVPERTYRNTCRSMMYEASIHWDFSTSLFFIVLPSDLDSWDNMDPSTHHFRLYFMCDVWDENGARGDIPQHVHFSNHPGYVLKRPAEFFRIYGDYVLRVLQMIKNGYSNGVYEIPPLNTLKILWNCDPDIIGRHITKDTIIPLVDKAIAYIQELSPPKWTTKLALDRSQSAAMKSFLDIRDGDNVEGNLLRYTNYKNQIVSWKCLSHTHQYLNLGHLQELRDFVSAHEGHIDMQQGRLRVELGSIAEADQFLTLLKGTAHIFVISFKLQWKATRSYVRDLCLDIAGTGTVVLELDGITPEIYPQSCMHNFFEFEILRKSRLRLMTLINYPWPQEQCIHIRGFSIQSRLTPIRPPSSWVELTSDLDKIGAIVSKATEELDSNTAARELKSVLGKHGLPSVTVVTIYDNDWNAVFDQESGVVVEVHLEDMVCPKGVLSAGSIRTLGVHLDDLSFDEEFLQIVQNRTLLQDLSVSRRGHDVLHYIETIVKMWHASACMFRLTLLDRMLDTRGRIVCQLAISESESDPAEGTVVDIPGRDHNPPSFSRHAADKPLDIVFLRWDCDHVLSQLSDYSASFLEMAAQQHPSVLTSFSLDVSQLSPVGLTSIQEVLRRSTLEHLNVVCTLFLPSQANEVARVLDSVQWDTLKSLVLSGNKINEWCHLWSSPASPRLLSLTIEGPSSVEQDLSHASVLFLQHLIFASPLIGLHLRGVQIQDKWDWVLLIDSLDLSLLQTLDLGEHCAVQFLSVSDAVDQFISGLNRLEAEGLKLVLPSFALDIATLSQTGLEYVQEIFNHCVLEKLVVRCHPIDFNMSSLVAKALDSVQWSTLEFMRLSGDNINHWIQILNGIDDAPRLKTLQILGTKSAQQGLSRASVLWVERLIGTSSLRDLRFEDILLQDQQDWVVLVGKVDPSMLFNFNLGVGSYEQFISSPDAVDLERSIWTE